MRDPEVVFSIVDGEWVPVEFWQDPTFHQHNEDGIDIGNFLDTWNGNIQAQGFVEAAKEELA
jgi:hypothetical protein